ncbi:hypothetical protein Hanom_Chr07g00617341 [Helianthus anomalus]
MSMLWAPSEPRGFPVNGLMNVFLSQTGGAMVVAGLPEGRPVWVDQLGDNFLHPISESMATHAKTVLGEDEIDVDPSPTREEPIILSSEESAGSYQDLIHRSTCTRKKKKEEKTEGKKAEEPVVETPSKRPSNSSFLDYVVVSDTLSSLDVGVKRKSRDPEDGSNLKEMMKKRKMLEDKNLELDAQAAAALAEKKSKFQKETISAPLESEIDLGVFSEKTRNRLENIFKSASVPRASSKSTHSGSRIDISKITPPASPPSKHLDLSPPRPDPKGKWKDDDVEVQQTEKVAANVAADTVYTKCVRGSTGGYASGTHQSPEFHRVQGGSWTTHNPVCDDLPHAPHWTLTQGSRMDNLPNCREFYSLSLPPS